MWFGSHAFENVAGNGVCMRNLSKEAVLHHTYLVIFSRATKYFYSGIFGSKLVSSCVILFHFHVLRFFFINTVTQSL